MELTRKDHWENIYGNKSLEDVSWYQLIPSTSLEFVEGFSLPKTASIIDVGGGDSFLVDHLLQLGYLNISVLDISEKAIEKAKKKLGPLADSVTWIVEDATQFVPNEKYDLWHDRAAFHFLTDDSEINGYVNLIIRMWCVQDIWCSEHSPSQVQQNAAVLR